MFFGSSWSSGAAPLRPFSVVGGFRHRRPCRQRRTPPPQETDPRHAWHAAAATALRHAAYAHLGSAAASTSLGVVYRVVIRWSICFFECLRSMGSLGLSVTRGHRDSLHRSLMGQVWGLADSCSGRCRRSQARFRVCEGRQRPPLAVESSTLAGSRRALPYPSVGLVVPRIPARIRHELTFNSTGRGGVTLCA